MALSQLAPFLCLRFGGLGHFLGTPPLRSATAPPITERSRGNKNLSFLINHLSYLLKCAKDEHKQPHTPHGGAVVIIYQDYKKTALQSGFSFILLLIETSHALY
jgi:hypothetical protein